MSIFKKLFGKKEEPAKPSSTQTPSPQAVAPVDPSKDPNMMRLVDSFGREVFLTRDQWRETILIKNLQRVWNQPDDLYGMIVSALNDGFRADVVDAAEHLYEIDPNKSRGACVLGVVLLEEGRLDEAEKIFRDYISKHGEEGLILTNLAKVDDRRKNHAKAEDLLWRALELDPNQPSGMGWYETIHRERSGAAAGLDALRRIAALPGSWRAQLWLGRAALQARQLDEALVLYKESLAHAGKPVPADLLMQMSGDLGNAAHLPEALALAEPHFEPAFHGLQVGNNLIKAHLDLGQIDHAKRILNQLYALKRPDWAKTLSFWDTEIAKAGLEPAQPAASANLEMALLTVQGPVWLKSDSPATELFPAKPRNDVHISFLGSTAEVAGNTNQIEHQLADAAGRMSRALPLYFAEHLDFAATARVTTLVPWVVSSHSGFVLGGVPWTDEEAATYARQISPPSDYVVVSHLRTKAEPWTLELRLVRTIDARRLAELGGEIRITELQNVLPGLADQLLNAIVSECGAQRIAASPTYRVPAAPRFDYYLLRLEQLLAVRCAAMDGPQKGSLSGERDIIDGNIQLCLEYPDNVTTRVLFAQTLLTMKKARPDILPEFGEKIALLQKQAPLPEPAQSVIQRLFDDAFSK